MNGCKKIFHPNGNQKRVGIAIYLSGKKKKDFKPKMVTQEKKVIIE